MLQFRREQMIMKMSMLKKIAVCASAGVMFASFSATIASAANDDYAKFNSSSYAAYTDSLTKADKAAIAAKEAQSVKLGAQKAAYGNAVTMNTLPGFTVYQSTVSDPVAACIYNTLMYVVKKSPSQATISNTVKKDFAKIPAYVNARASKCHYVVTQPKSAANLANYINYDINTAKIPTFLRLTNLNAANWYYVVGSTSLLAVGISSDKSLIRIADPFVRRVAGCPNVYMKSASVVYQHVTHVCW